jgi:hypothetical protein
LVGCHERPGLVRHGTLPQTIMDGGLRQRIVAPFAVEGSAGPEVGLSGARRLTRQTVLKKAPGMGCRGLVICDHRTLGP